MWIVEEADNRREVEKRTVFRSKLNAVNYASQVVIKLAQQELDNGEWDEEGEEDLLDVLRNHGEGKDEEAVTAWQEFASDMDRPETVNLVEAEEGD